MSGLPRGKLSSIDWLGFILKCVFHHEQEKFSDLVFSWLENLFPCKTSPINLARKVCSPMRSFFKKKVSLYFAGRGKRRHCAFLNVLSLTFMVQTMAFKSNSLTGLELSISESRFGDRLCLLRVSFLWNSWIKTFFVLRFLSSGKPRSFCLRFKVHNLLLQKVWNCALFSCVWLTFWSDTPS